MHCDRSPHQGFMGTQLWPGPGRGGGGAGVRGGQQGQAQGSVMYAVRLRVLSDSDTSACHRGHQLHLVTAAARPSPRLQLRANSINS